ncbi:MAG: NADH:flavin oxidoreductase [Desulfosporosinus sp. BRH_c37]|nr:MAG: NADH:flavin oxidoreductase [Desulfosporosinus sp. BRH_c37]
MNTEFPHLFSPIRLGPITLKNRIVFPAHLTNFAENHLPSDRHTYYYGERARGGAGLIITEEQSVHPTDVAYEKLIDAFDSRVIPGYLRMTTEVHKFGGKILAQLNHNGQQGSSAFTRRALWGPSSVPDPLFREIPKAMDKADMQEVIRGFCLVAEHTIKGRFDGCEVQSSHSSLLRQFMSPLTNKRTDEYGGSFTNRMRFPIEIMTALRRVLGKHHALGIRLSGDELVDGGLTLDDMKKVAANLDELHLIDFINTSTANFHNLFMVEGSMHVPLGYNTYAAAGLKEVVGVPVFAAGRINAPAQAERILTNGQADLVCIARGQICDAEFANKTLEGRHQEIRQCIACNQGCAARTGLNRDLGCLQNPTSGREGIFKTHSLQKAENVKKVMVVGGGPAGLEVAKEAARRGHRVTLYERAEKLGGQINLLARVPNREEFSDVIRNQTQEIEQLPVSILLGVEVTPGLVEGERPDVIVVATGSEAAPSYLAGADQSHVLTFYEVLAGREVPGDNVLIIDDIGFHQGTSIAEYLAYLNKKVSILSAGLYVAPDLMTTMDIQLWYRRALDQGIEMITNSIVRTIGSDSVTIFNHYNGQERVLNDITAVVLVGHPKPREELYYQIKGMAPEVYRIGDCLAPRKMEHAIYEGFKVGRSI